MAIRGYLRPAATTIVVAVVGLLLVFYGLWLMETGAGQATVASYSCPSNVNCTAPSPPPATGISSGTLFFWVGAVVLAAGTLLIGTVSFLQAYRKTA